MEVPALFRVLEYTLGDGCLDSPLRTLKYGSALLSVFFKVQPAGEVITKYKVKYIDNTPLVFHVDTRNSV